MNRMNVLICASLLLASCASRPRQDGGAASPTLGFHTSLCASSTAAFASDLRASPTVNAGMNLRASDRFMMNAPFTASPTLDFSWVLDQGRAEFGVLELARVKLEGDCDGATKEFHRHINSTTVAQRITIRIKNEGECTVGVLTAAPGANFKASAEAAPGATGSGTVEIPAGGTLVFAHQCVKVEKKKCKGEIVLSLHL